MSKADHIKR